MKRFLLRASIGMLFASPLLLAACAPQAAVQNQVVPTLISVTIPPEGGPVVLQGRYFGDGRGGENEESYVLVGADIDGEGGVRVDPSTWTPSRIEFAAPGGAGYGFVYVVVKGVRSNGLPANLR